MRFGIVRFSLPHSSRSLMLIILALMVPLLGKPTTSNATTSPGSITIASLTSDGTQASGVGPLHAMSRDGNVVAFVSAASDYVAEDTNSAADIFVHDRTTGQTTRVSVASNGTQANSSSDGPSISGDGRYVAFSSLADNLVTNDTNYNADIFVHDRTTGQTTRVSVASNGTQGDDRSLDTTISEDGRYVSFLSFASNFANYDGYSADVFVHDRISGETTVASVNSNGTLLPGGSDHPTLSGNGRFVAFNYLERIFVHDRENRITREVSVSTTGESANNWSKQPSISFDGRYISFYSLATNLVPNVNRNQYDVFIHDQVTGETKLVSAAINGSQANNSSTDSSISADGRFVAFLSWADDLVINDSNDAPDVFLRDLEKNETVRISEAIDGTDGNDRSEVPIISPDGRYISFYSQASNLVLNDSNNNTDILVRDLGIPGSPFPSISGRITDNTGAPLEGITIQMGLSGVASSNEDGIYTITGLPAGTYEFRASSPVHTFDPPSRTVTVPPNAVEQNFIATPVSVNSTIEYFALGDSVASGHGLMDDTKDGLSASGCRRSARAYPYKVATWLKDRYRNVNFHHLACSGATAVKPKSLNTTDPMRYKWLENQASYVLNNLPTDRPVLVTISIGANDFGWSDPKSFEQHLYKDTDGGYDKWVVGTVAAIKKNLKLQVDKLTAYPNVTVIISEYHNPLNRESIFFQYNLGKKSHCGLFIRPCYERVEKAIHHLNDTFHALVIETQKANQLQVAKVHDLFHGHESPRTSCGSASPDVADSFGLQTWIQYRNDPESNSNPPIPDTIAGPGMWSGDCFHPNETGAAQFAAVVNGLARDMGR